MTFKSKTMNTLKKITLALLFISLSSMGQEIEKREKIKALKVAYLTSELSLTATEAEKFWPIYNEFENKQFEIRYTKMRPLRTKINNSDLSDKEIQNILLQFESYEEELHQNKKKLDNSLNSILSPSKILKLKLAEGNFNKKLLQRYKENASKK
jgi:Spy/CpxP family protein refolding chaperone